MVNNKPHKLEDQSSNPQAVVESETHNTIKVEMGLLALHTIFTFSEGPSFKTKVERMTSDADFNVSKCTETHVCTFFIICKYIITVSFIYN